MWPLIAALIGAGTSLYQGIQGEQRNREMDARSAQATAAQQALIGKMLGEISPEAYLAQADRAGQGAVSQLMSRFAGNGMLSSGAMHTAGLNALMDARTNALAKYQSDRLGAYGTALGGQQAIHNQYVQGINPNPYSGFSASLGGLGTLLGSMYGSRKTP